MRFDPTFSAEVRAFGQRVASLREGIRTGHSAQAHQAALGDLQAAEEELRAAEEELRAQNEDLTTMQARLEEERARYRDLFENAPDAIILTNDRGVVFEANAAAVKLLGIPVDYLTGKSLLRYIDARDLVLARRLIRDLRHTHAPREFTARLVPRRGPALHVAILVSALTKLHELGERFIGVRWVIRDATARIKAETEILTLREQIKRLQAERIAGVPQDLRHALDDAAREHTLREKAEHASHMKDQFLALVVHELTNPLTPVLAVLDDQLEKRDPETSRSMLEMMRRNLLAQSRIIADLLDIARVIHGKLELRAEPVLLADPINDAIAGLTPAALAKHQNLRAEISGAPIVVNADVTRLRQVFWNLISNAIKFTPAGGEITVRLLAGPQPVMEVQDTGVGISAQALTIVFDPFEQSGSKFARSLGGMGLGLSIVRALIEAHGGTVEVESPGEGKGSTFRVRLPRSLESLRPAAPTPGKISGPARPLNILLVEDHIDTRKILANLLSRMGHNVAIAGSVEEALEQVERTKFDLTLSDLSLPDGSGRDLLARAPRDHVGLAVACTGWGMPEDIEQSLSAGFAIHLTKPVSLQQLRDVIDKISPTGDSPALQ